MSDPRVILLVEDNADDVALARRAFGKMDREVRIVVASDGAEAIEMLLGDDDGKRVHPRMVLLDLKLPKVDGLGVLRRIRSDVRTRHLPVVVMSSSADDRDVGAAYELGANSFVRKPVDYARFVEAARQIHLYWLQLNHPAPVTTSHARLSV